MGKGHYEKTRRPPITAAAGWSPAGPETGSGARAETHLSPSSWNTITLTRTARYAAVQLPRRPEGLSERENVARWICLPVKIPSSTAGTPSPGTFNLIKRIPAGGLYHPAVHGTGQGDTGVWERSFHCPSLLLHASSVGQYLMAGITPSSEYDHHRCTTVGRTHYTDIPLVTS